MTRNGAPFQGATGEGRTTRSAASAQVADAATAGDSNADTGDAANPATGNNVAAATANQRARSMRKVPSRSNLTGIQPCQCGRFARYLWSNVDRSADLSRFEIGPPGLFWALPMTRA